MRFLKLRTETRPRANGEPCITPMIVDCSHRFAKKRQEQALCKKRCHLISGAHDSGKTRWLLRLFSQWQPIWGAKFKQPPVFLDCLSPLSSWIDFYEIGLWYDQGFSHQDFNDNPYYQRPWRRLNQQQKLSLLPHYIHENKTLVFIDDAHRLTGLKAQIVRRCVMKAPLWIMSTLQENRLPPSLRPIVERREPQRTALLSHVGYDATGALLGCLTLMSLLIGWWELSLIFASLKLLGNGRRASRAD